MKNITYLALLIFVFLGSVNLTSQSTDIRLEAHDKRNKIEEGGWTTHLSSENIGPTVFSGRISNVAVNPKNPAEFYAAYASGGLWYTNNNGTTFEPVFDNEAVITIGDVAVNWKDDIIWLGTGEVNSSRSSYAGVGIYKSSDKGKTWTHHGLEDTHHIGRIVLHPSYKDIAWVAALGHLYTTNPERGVFKTIDGGANWAKTLFVNDNSGVVDLVMDPSNSDILYAATWDRIRHAWDFQESGTGSGIYKSTDGGISWDKMNTDTSGFPNNEGTGRIGLDVVSKDGKTYLYAILDNYNRRPNKTKEKADKLDKNAFELMTKDEFIKLPDNDLQEYLDNNGFPRKYNATSVKGLIEKDEIEPIALKEYVENANSLLFDTPVIGTEVYISIDGGSQWNKTHDYYLDGVYNSYGYYFGQIRIDPTDPDKIYIMGVPILRSDNGGKDWNNISGGNVHADHHALWINPLQPGHVINGNDGGINISYDHGENWIKCNSPSVGQFYYINVDNDEPYNVYGGTQDNGVWVGGNNYRKGVRWQMRGDYPYKAIMGGDGMQVQIDNRDNNTVYTGFQFGNYFRINKKTGDRSYITPKHELGNRPYRWNWQSPILLSSHNQDILYMGANKLVRSMDKGDSFTEISEDLTHGGKKGDVAYGTLTTISESPFKFGHIYTGSDDGKVMRTIDGGNTWTDLGQGLPSDKWVSRIIASTHNENRVLISLNGYRDDDFTSYLYISDDKGDTWTSISASLPSEPINVVKEDPSNPDILYVGTDHGTYVTIDRGQSFMLIDQSIPRVPVHDLVVQERDADLLIGTHGRSIYKVELEAIHELPSVISSKIHLYELNELRHRDSWGSKRRPYSDVFEPKVNMIVFSKESGKARLNIKAGDHTVNQLDVDLKKGLQSLTYDLSISPDKIKKLTKHLRKHSDSKDAAKVEAADNGSIYLKPGTYTIELELKGTRTSQTLKIN